jgi:hypothetical protein
MVGATLRRALCESRLFTWRLNAGGESAGGLQ